MQRSHQQEGLAIKILGGRASLGKKFPLPPSEFARPLLYAHFRHFYGVLNVSAPLATFAAISAVMSRFHAGLGAMKHYDVFALVLQVWAT